MKNFEISEKVQKSLMREREVVFQSSQFTEIGWQELPVANRHHHGRAIHERAAWNSLFFFQLSLMFFLRKYLNKDHPKKIKTRENTIIRLIVAISFLIIWI